MSQTTAQGKLPIGATLRHGFSFAGSHWRALVPAIVVAALAHALSVYGQVIMLGQFQATQGLAPEAGLMIVAGLFVGCIAQAAMLRVALSDVGAPVVSGSPTPALSGDELRLFLANLLIVLLFLVLLFFAFLILTAVVALLSGGGQPVDVSRSAAGASGIDPQSTNGMLFLMALLSVGFLYLGGRLMLVAPATVLNRRVSVLSTFGWTRGNGWRCLMAIIVIGAPGVLIAAFVSGLIVNLLGAPGGQAIEPKTFALQMSGLGYFASELVAGLAIGAVQVAQAGALAYLLRGLRPAATTQ